MYFFIIYICNSIWIIKLQLTSVHKVLNAANHLQCSVKPRSGHCQHGQSNNVRAHWIWALSAHNWQKWKRVFLTCPCHKIYRDETVGIKKVANILEKIRFMRIHGIWGNFVKIWYFVNNCLIKVPIKKFFCTYVTHIIVIICSTEHFVST